MTGEAVDKERLTRVGRALSQLGIEHIPAYSPEARGRSERAFGTLQGRLPKEFRLFGITEIEAANRYIREIYLPMHNELFARAPQIPEESAFVKVRDPDALADVLCVQQHRVVARDNTVSYEGRCLQLPQSPARPHYVKANVRVHEYPDDTLAVFHGPLRLARYTAEGEETADVPTARSVTPCSPPSRRGLDTPELMASSQRRPALTASARGVPGALQVGTKKRSPGRTKKLSKGGKIPRSSVRAASRKAASILRPSAFDLIELDGEGCWRASDHRLRAAQSERCRPQAILKLSALPRSPAGSACGCGAPLAGRAKR
jgi:hypothetical protein